MTSVAVVKNGALLTWSCLDCPGAGLGVESMTDHYRRTGHEWMNTKEGSDDQTVFDRPW